MLRLKWYHSYVTSKKYNLRMSYGHAGDVDEVLRQNSFLLQSFRHGKDPRTSLQVHELPGWPIYGTKNWPSDEKLLQRGKMLNSVNQHLKKLRADKKVNVPSSPSSSDQMSRIYDKAIREAELTKYSLRHFREGSELRLPRVDVPGDSHSNPSLTAHQRSESPPPSSKKQYYRPIIIPRPPKGSKPLASEQDKRPIQMPSRPIQMPSRPIQMPSRPIQMPSGPILRKPVVITISRKQPRQDKPVANHRKPIATTIGKKRPRQDEQVINHQMTIHTSGRSEVQSETHKQGRTGVQDHSRWSHPGSQSEANKKMRKGMPDSPRRSLSTSSTTSDRGWWEKLLRDPSSIVGT